MAAIWKSTRSCYRLSGPGQIKNARASGAKISGLSGSYFRLACIVPSGGSKKRILQALEGVFPPTYPKTGITWPLLLTDKTCSVIICILKIR